MKKNIKKAILNKNLSTKILPILRKIVTEKEGTASLANVRGYEMEEKQEQPKEYLWWIFKKK